jgi:lipoprotein-releasing system ATP-binding protein
MDTVDNIVSATEVYRQFQTADATIPVLKGVTFNLSRTDMASVTGASGVGKSTLLHILGGLDRPNKGKVTVSGEELHNKSETWLARFRNRRIGFVFQFHYLLEDFSALENVMIPMLAGGVDKSGAATEAEHLLEAVGLKDRMSHRPDQLSGGEQQRVAVARALSNKPDVILADEPSGNLDIATGRKLHDLLIRLNQELKMTFLIATHNTELARECDRRFQLADGKIVSEA